MMTMDETTRVSTANVEPIMKEALGWIQAEEKREYLQALEAAPALVATETSHAKFLRVENNNPYAAARRLCMYWKFRKECHGADRWLRPMTCTGTGALGEAEVALLRTGIYHYSHEPGYGPVLVIDGARNKQCTIVTVDRVIFYLATILEDQVAQTTGITVVYAVTSDDTESKIDDRLGVYAALGLPVKVRRFCVVQNYESGKEPLLEFLAVRRKLQVDLNFKSNCHLIASNQSQSHLLSMVESWGIPSKALPKGFGGGFGEEVLCDWLRQRLSVEDCLSLNATVATFLPVTCSANSNNNHQLVPSRSRQATAVKRKPNTVQGYQQEIKNLHRANDELRANNRQLEEWLPQARKIALEQQMVAVTGTCCTVVPPPIMQSYDDANLPLAMDTPDGTALNGRGPTVNDDYDFLFGIRVADPYEGDEEKA